MIGKYQASSSVVTWPVATAVPISTSVKTQAAARRAGLAVDAHSHMLRHAYGYALADQGADTRLIQDYLGHKQIQNTVRYTALNPNRFVGLW